MNRLLLFLPIVLLLCTPLPSVSKEIKSRYATVKFFDPALLRKFNKKIRLNRKLNYHFRKRKVVTVEDEVLAKIDILIQKAEIVLNMFPDKLHIAVVLLPTSRDVSKVYKKKYGKKVNHIAYYSLSEDTIYISVSDTRLRVLAHEIGHAIVDHFFEVRPPYNIHELMAQFTEKHITD